MWDLNRLRLLRELELRGTIAQVAAALSYSPANVSQQLSQLEREVGYPLLEPDGRRLRLTLQGQAVSRHAEAVLQLEERARQALDALGPADETVRVATVASATRALLPRVLRALNASPTGPRLELFAVAPEVGLLELEARRYDIVIAEEYPGHARARRDHVDYAQLGRDPMRVVLAPDSDARTLGELADHAWVLEPGGTAARYWAVQQCRAAGFEPQVRYEATDLDAHVALIAAGHAVGILPDLIWTGHEPPLRRLDLPRPLERELFTAVRAASADSPAIRSVRLALSEAFAAQAASSGTDGTVGAAEPGS